MLLLDLLLQRQLILFDKSETIAFQEKVAQGGAVKRCYNIYGKAHVNVHAFQKFCKCYVLLGQVANSKVYYD